MGRLELPVDRYPARRPPEPEEDEPNRGVIILGRKTAEPYQS